MCHRPVDCAQGPPEMRTARATHAPDWEVLQYPRPAAGAHWRPSSCATGRLLVGATVPAKRHRTSAMWHLLLCVSTRHYAPQGCALRCAPRLCLARQPCTEIENHFHHSDYKEGMMNTRRSPDLEGYPQIDVEIKGRFRRVVIPGDAIPHRRCSRKLFQASCVRTSLPVQFHGL